MRRNIVVKPEKIEEIKKTLQYFGVRETSRKVNVSYYTCWCVSQGKYDREEPLQSMTKWNNRCFITGFKLN